MIDKNELIKHKWFQNKLGPLSETIWFVQTAQKQLHERKATNIIFIPLLSSKKTDQFNALKVCKFRFISVETEVFCI